MIKFKMEKWKYIVLVKFLLNSITWKLFTNNKKGKNRENNTVIAMLVYDYSEEL